MYQPEQAVTGTGQSEPWLHTSAPFITGREVGTEGWGFLGRQPQPGCIGGGVTCGPPGTRGPVIIWTPKGASWLHDRKLQQIFNRPSDSIWKSPFGPGVQSPGPGTCVQLERVHQRFSTPDKWADHGRARAPCGPPCPLDRARPACSGPVVGQATTHGCVWLCLGPDGPRSPKLFYSGPLQKELAALWTWG